MPENDELLDVEPDPEVKDELEVASHLGDAGREQLLDRLREHNDTSPELSAGDIDAGWDQDAVGEELPGGGNPTPDQDVVEEIGRALGYTYEDNEPLKTGDKLEERDRDRWELDERSAEDFGENLP
jgi:hypothetical protein